MAHISVSESKQKINSVTDLEYGERMLRTSESSTNPILEKMISEGGIDFYNYLCWIGLSGQSNIMVLSSMKHYYYDHSDLRNIGVLISMKKLNQVTHLESFIHTLFRLLPCKSHFIGCFYNTSEEAGLLIRKIPGRIFHGFGSGEGGRSGMALTKRSASNLLANNGFNINDLTDINGLTYFWSQNNRRLGG